MLADEMRTTKYVHIDDCMRAMSVEERKLFIELMHSDFGVESDSDTE